MILNKETKPIRINYELLKPRWITILHQGSGKTHSESFYKIIRVGFTDAVCIPLSISNRIEAETVEEEYLIAIAKPGYAASLHHISTRAEIPIYGILLRSGEKKLNE